MNVYQGAEKRFSPLLDSRGSETRVLIPKRLLIHADWPRIVSGIGAILPGAGAWRLLAAAAVIFAAVFASRADAQTCSFTVAPSAIFLDASAQSASVTVTASAADCVWTESTADNFIASPAAASTGSGPASFTVSVNGTNTDRVGSVTVAGQTVSVTQRFTTTPFGDINPSDFYFDAVNLLKIHTITDGCEASPLLFCPDDIVTRDQMAIFLVRAPWRRQFHGFDDALFHRRAAHHLRLPLDTEAPRTRNYEGMHHDDLLPLDEVSRDDMALFLIRLRYGLTIAGNPPTFNYPVTPYFTDVTASDPAFPWVQRLKQDGITSGCTVTTYCPDLEVSRGEMAVFLMRAALNQLLTGPTPLITQIIPSTWRPAQREPSPLPERTPTSLRVRRRWRQYRE